MIQRACQLTPVTLATCLSVLSPWTMSAGALSSAIDHYFWQRPVRRSSAVDEVNSLATHLAPSNLQKCLYDVYRLSDPDMERAATATMVPYKVQHCKMCMVLRDKLPLAMLMETPVKDWICGFIVDWKPILTYATFGCKTSALDDQHHPCSQHGGSDGL